MMTYNKVDDNQLDIEIFGNTLKDEEYVAVGFSDDTLMNDDFVFACTKEQVSSMYNAKDNTNYFVAQQENFERLKIIRKTVFSFFLTSNLPAYSGNNLHFFTLVARA